MLSCLTCIWIFLVLVKQGQICKNTIKSIKNCELVAATSQNGGQLAWSPMMAVTPDRTLNTGINTSYYIQNIVWPLMMAKLAQRVKQRN